MAGFSYRHERHYPAGSSQRLAPRWNLKIGLNSYFQKIRENLRLGSIEEKEILRELETHVEERFQEMKDEGLSEEESLKKSLNLLGSAREVARQYYEVHSQGNWRQALLAGMPHLFFTAVFVLNWLNSLAWLPVLMIVIGVIAVYGYTHGKPTWLFPWLGYTLLPVAGAGVSMLYLPAGWSWVTLALYIPLVIWLSCYIVTRFMRRDWLYTTLMLLPVPSFVGWFLAPRHATGLRLGFISQYAPWVVLTFILLAFSTSVFMRLRNRKARILVLILSCFVTVLIGVVVNIQVGVLAFLGLILLLLAVFLMPVFIERAEKHRQVSV